MSQRSAATALLVLPVLALLAACQDDDIRVYDAPRPQAQQQQQQQQEQRMTSQQQPQSAASPHAAAAGGELAWTLPEGWEQAAQTSSMRYATLLAGSGEERVEVAVSRLGGDAGGLAANVNRWRGQLGLPPASNEALHESVQHVEEATLPVLLVDIDPRDGDAANAPDTPQRMLVGLLSASGQTWFLKMTGPAAVVDTHADAMLQLLRSLRWAEGPGAMPAAHPPHAGPRDDGSEMRWTAPPNWKLEELEPEPPRIAAFELQDDAGERGEVTIVRMPGGGGDPVMNINRWREQAGLEPIEKIEDQAIMPLEVDASRGAIIDLQGPEVYGEPGKRVMAAIIPRGHYTWFIKIHGPAELVEANHGEFAHFLHSIRFGSGER